jgi:hypothetical protein
MEKYNQVRLENIDMSEEFIVGGTDTQFTHSENIA